MTWQQFFDQENTKSYMQFLNKRIWEKRNLHKDKIYPKDEDTFRAFDLTFFHDVKVVIIGQDPYYNENQANGLAFSVNEDVDLPPSLRNIFKELKGDLDIDNRRGDLSNWAKQGVLLLNTVLTVEADKPNSHQGLGWEIMTDNAIKYVSDNAEHVVFVLWGKNAQSKENLIDINKHFVIKSSHPSPLSAHVSFFGSKPFSKINDQLSRWGMKEIDWRIE